MELKEKIHKNSPVCLVTVEHSMPQQDVSI